MEVDVLIPVYRPDGKLTELLKRLKMQNYPIHRVILMNTEENHFPAELIGIWDRVEVYHLAKEEFDHGGTVYLRDGRHVGHHAGDPLLRRYRAGRRHCGRADGGFFRNGYPAAAADAEE